MCCAEQGGWRVALVCSRCVANGRQAVWLDVHEAYVSVKETPQSSDDAKLLLSLHTAKESEQKNTEGDVEGQVGAANNCATMYALLKMYP